MKHLFTISLILALFICPARSADEDETKPLTYNFYGYIKLDSAYDTARTDVGNFARWVMPQPGGEDDDQFNMTANQSRFGVRFKGPENERFLVSGQAEIDFFGGGAENKANPMMRHAFLSVHWKEADLTLIAGQTWDVISPLNAPTVNYSVAWWSGNIGYRRPQIRLTKSFRTEGGTSLQVAGAVLRTVGDKTGFDPGDSGEDNAFPTLQGRIGLTTPLGEDTSFAIGISGHYGQEEYDIAADGTNLEFDSWSANVDLLLKFPGGIILKGEYFTGKNLDSYLGGIGQGLNLVEMAEIESTGGWASLTLPVSDDVSINLAGAMDDPDDETVTSGQRSFNSSIWGNINYKLVQNVTVGVELARWETEYKDGGEYDNLRGQLAFTYSF